MTAAGVALSPEAATEAQQDLGGRLDGAEVTSQLPGLYGWESHRAVRALQGTAYGP